VLKYTGHPFVDIGVATIAAFAGKRDPGQLTVDDLDRMADFIEREYARQPLKSFLTVAFTSNSWFAQYAFETQPDKRTDYATRLLRSYGQDTPQAGTECVFMGGPAIGIALSDKLQRGRAFRQHIPMLTGEGFINFHPNGDAGLSVSGEALLCLQAFPLGCANCGGRLLAVHSGSDEITHHFAQKFLQSNLRALQLARLANAAEMARTRLMHHTLLIETLLDAELMRTTAEPDETAFSITAYRFTNGKTPDLDIYHLPLQAVCFLRDMHRAKYADRWQAIVRRAWEVEPSKRSKKSDEPAFQPRRNHLYEDLFRLPDNAPHFIRTYFLRQPLRHAREDFSDPRRDYSPQREVAVISWTITEQFLGRIINMHKERIQQISTLGERLAQYVSSHNDRRFFREFFRQQRYDYLRTLLIRANLAQVRSGGAPLFGLDPYLTVFEEGDEVVRTDWRLSRDLVLIRMIEQLYALGWLGEQPELLAETTDEPALEPSPEG
jgi:CRISPR-associated protein Cst1